MKHHKNPIHRLLRKQPGQKPPVVPTSQATAAARPIFPQKAAEPTLKVQTASELIDQCRAQMLESPQFAEQQYAVQQYYQQYYEQCYKQQLAHDLQQFAQQSQQQFTQQQSAPMPDELGVEQVSELMRRTIPEKHWVVPGLLGEGVTILAGKPKIGKSWLVLDLALAVAQGGLALGHFPATQTGVLHLSLEDSSFRYQSRVSHLLQGQPVPAGLRYSLDWAPFHEGGLLDLSTYLRAAPDTRLVIIDTLARVRGLAGTYQQDYQLMASLQDLASSFHITLLLVHHTRKTASADPLDMMSGSTGLPGGADAGFVLTRHRGRQEAILHAMSRDLPDQSLALTFHEDACTWRVIGTSEEHQQVKSRLAVLNLIAEGQTITPAEVSMLLEIPRGTAYSLLFRMEREHLIVKSKRGLYTLPTPREE